MDELDSNDPTDGRRNGDEVRLRARPMSRGVAIGRIVCLHGTTRQFYRIDIQDGDIDRELRRARASFRLARRQLSRLATAQSARSLPGILEAQRAMIEDSSLLTKVEDGIREQKVNA